MTTASDNTKGALMMIAGMAAYTLSDAAMKILGEELPLFQTLVWRGIGVSLVLFLLAWRAGVLGKSMTPSDRKLLILRTLADTVTTWFFLNALYQIPIANLTAIVQSLPLTVTLAAAIFLGEPLGWRRLVAIGVGFVGVLMIVRPGTDGFSIYALYGLVAVGLITLRDLVTRKMSRDVPSLTVSLWNALAVTLFGVLGSTTETWVMPSANAWPLLVGAASVIVGGYLLTVMAVRTGELGFVTPFRYMGLVWALIVGLAVFGEWPDLWTQLGAALIVATGLFTFFRERQLQRLNG